MVIALGESGLASARRRSDLSRSRGEAPVSGCELL
jgi:hypothetical protein